MNQDKARDFFSAYYEGNLDAGLRQTVEQKLRTDAALQAEYRAFEETMEDLGTLKFDRVVVPASLSEKIANRLREDRLKRQEPASRGVRIWVRSLGFAALAAVAVIGAVMSMRSSGGASVAGTVPQFNAPDQMSFLMRGTQVELSYKPSSARVIDVAVGPSMQRQTVQAGQKLLSPLVNPNAHAVVFNVQIEGEKSGSTLFVPGTEKSDTLTGQGKVSDFLLAFADHYRLPVLVSSGDLNKPVTWDFGADEPLDAAKAALGDMGFVIEQKIDGLVGVSDH
jgi:anti-sigma factor RsiW